MAEQKSTDKENRYAALMASIFKSKYRKGMREVEFARAEFEIFAQVLKIVLPLNLGDIVYSFRYRAALPESIQGTAKSGECWIIRPTGKGKYKFALVENKPLAPNPMMTLTKVPDSTPGIVAKYAFADEQALLAKVRYNRLIDVFTGLTCYSLQNHLRTTVPQMGQVETDEIYVGLDKKGAHYVIPVQAKGGTDKLGIVQIEQDFAVCANRYPTLICRPIAAQFMAKDVIAMFEFAQNSDGVGVYSEKHYKLVPPKDVTEEDLLAYREKAED
ncbi:MAG: hypothetical protein ACLPXT_09140 [Terracidiphilus sp.]